MLDYPVKFMKHEGITASDEQIKLMLEHTKVALQQSEETCDYYFESLGNTMIIGFKYEDTYEFIVTRNFESLKVIEEELGGLKF